MCTRPQTHWLTVLPGGWRLPVRAGPSLLPEEKAEGWILPCVACADSDLQISAPLATELPARRSGLP